MSEEDLPQIIVIPNHLQAPQAADIVYKDNIVYIIKCEPDEESTIHEYLHFLFNNSLHDNKTLINKYLHLLKPVLEQMIKYQYAWDYGIDSWNRVFEENLMRAASLWVCNYTDIEKAVSKANEYADDGFAYVPIILESFIGKWTTLSHFRQFFNICLEECNKEYMRYLN